MPWREFQPSMEPVRYEEYAFDNLNRVMDAAGRHGLDVMFRVGYTWDYSKPEGQDGILERYRRLLYDDTARAAWRDYVSTLYQTAAVYPNFAGGFLTWEDFWNFVESAGSYGRGKDSREMAEKIGYSSYVAERYSWDEINALYGADFGAAEDIYLPSQDSPAFRLFFEFYDTFPVSYTHLDVYKRQTMCRLVTEAGADFIKTSTGFSAAGATFADCLLYTSRCV